MCPLAFTALRMIKYSAFLTLAGGGRQQGISLESWVLSMVLVGGDLTYMNLVECGAELLRCITADLECVPRDGTVL